VVAIAVLFAGAAAVVFVRNYAVFLILVLVRYLGILLVASAASASVLVGWCLLADWLCMLALFEPFPRNVWVGLIAIVCFVAVDAPTESLGAFATYVRTPEAVVFIVVAVVLLVAASLVTHYRERYVRASTELTRMAQAVEQLANANTGFQHYAAKAKEESSRQERERITRELHDIIGYALTSVGMMIEAARQVAPEEPRQLKEILQQARMQTSECFEKSRSAIHNLRSKMAGPDTGMTDIARLCRVFGDATGIVVRTEFGNAANSYGAELDELLYRAVQEGLVNAFRHGNATLVEISFWEESDQLVLTVVDNGEGSTSVHKGIGLHGMEERAAQFKGTLSAGSGVRGFSLTLTVPLTRDQDREQDTRDVG
jgi:signal transduction histidine kinase